MRLKIIVMVLLLLTAAPLCSAQVMAVGNRKVFSVAPVTWTVIQHENNLSCSAYSCSISNVTTTPGDLLILSSSLASATSSTFLSASGDSTWTHCPSALAQMNPGGYYLQSDCAYVISSAGVTNGTFTFTWNNGGANYGTALSLIEVRRSSGTAAYDTSGNTSSAACTSCDGPVLTLTGKSDYVVQMAAANGTTGAPSAPWNDPFDTFVAGAANQPAGSSQVVWPFPSTSAVVMGAVAFK